ncbi:cytochrome P450 [Mycena capillaripes]|nr:cytochrome P450 [Mycena capillaripes]
MDPLVPYATALTVFVSTFVAYLVFQRQSTVRNIVGPPCSSWIFGHMRELLLPPQYGYHEFSWQKLYGPVYRLKGCFGQDRLMVSDPGALQYILNSPIFCRAPVLEGMINLIFGGKSVIAARGDEHHRLRSALNVGFTAAAVRNYEPVFQKVAMTVSERFEESSGVSTNIRPLLGMATLTAISEAVLGISIDALGEDFVANSLQIVDMTASQSEGQILADAIGGRLPAWCWHAAMYFPTTAGKIIRKERYFADRTGRRIVQEKMDAAAKGLESDTDVFGLLLTPENSDDTKKLSVDDVVAQTAIVLLAGQETTANAVAFGLLELARNADFQDELRAEIHSTIGKGGKTIAYDTMPLLNALIKVERDVASHTDLTNSWIRSCKETLRFYPAGPLSDRVPTEDAVIPLKEAIVTSTGERISQIQVKKGQLLTVAIASYQRLPSRWGDEPDRFNPSRWLNGRTFQEDAVSPYANLLSFNGGPRICLGWRFAILEMQVIFCELVAKFSFAEVENEPVRVKFMNNLLPIVPSGDRALPLRITRIL